MLNLLREVVKRVLLENVEVSEDATFAIAQFVSGELMYDEVNIGAFEDELRPFMRRFNGLYRVWQHHDANVPEAQIEAEARSRDLMSATRDPSTIPEMLDLFGVDEGEFAVTKFDGIGFVPYEVMQVGLESNPNMDEAGFVRAVLNQYSYQQEVIVTKLVGPLRKVDAAKVTGR